MKSITLLCDIVLETINRQKQKKMDFRKLTINVKYNFTDSISL